MQIVIKNYILLLGIFISAGSVTNAQILDFLNRVDVVLDDGTSVTMYGAADTRSDRFRGEYYYLPTNLRLGQKKDRSKTPEFLFMKYTTEERNDAGGVGGALLHFLMEWGLTAAQEEEVQQKLKAKINDLSAGNPRFRSITNPRLMGAADLSTDPENSFEIISAVLRDNQSTPTLVTSGRAPTLPGGKVAVAAKLEKNAAQLLAASFEKARSITDVSVSLLFQYKLLMPAVEGKITVDWTKVDSVYRNYRREARHYDGGSKGQSDDYVSDYEKDTLFSMMRETKAVNVELTVTDQESQIAQDMVSAFMEYFLRSVSEKEFRRPESEADNPERSGQKDYKYGYETYIVDRKRLEQKVQRRNETYTLKVRLPITKDLVLTENLSSWYDNVRDNKRCVGTVNLNDPFFDYRDIYLILDLDAEEMFGKELNYVTVDIRKRRNKGNDFSEQITFDKKFFVDNGNRTIVTYSRAEDTNPDVFEYKAQWSLRSGNVYPIDTSWTKGSWEGVTLAPPVMPTPIKFEADLEDLKDLDIVNVSLQLRYYKFGKPVQTSFNITTSSNVGYLEKDIFMDRNTQGYAYRMIFYHKKKGQLATDWDARINTGYMYAVIPDELRNGFLEEMIERGKEILRGADGQIIKEDSVLDQYKDLIITN